jgi:nucleotide-binding universal stress UspA family protein
MRLLESVRNASDTPAALTRTELGSPARRLVEAAEERAAKFIVIGSGLPRHRLARLVERVGEQVIRTAPCPVVVVPAR